jgi:hypothetical protein
MKRLLISSSLQRTPSFYFRSFSSSNRNLVPPEEAKSASERVHGSIDPSTIRSKAMRAKLLKGTKHNLGTTANTTETETNNTDDSESKALLSQRDQEQQNQYQQQHQNQYQQPTFGQVMYSNLISGFGIAIGFMIVGVVFRSLFGGGGNSHAQIRQQPIQQVPRYTPQPVDADPIFSNGSDQLVEEDDGDPYATKTSSSSSLARRSTSL